MSEYLANRLNSLYSNFNYKDVEYDTIITLHCEIHGTYNKTVTQILYKNPSCPICTKINKNKRLSEIGKTKVGELNSFYGHHHTDEVCKKMSHPLSEETKQKISNTVKSEECQNRTKQTCLKKYGVEHYTNKEKAVTTCIERYGGIGNQSEIIRHKIQQTNLERYGYKDARSSKEVQAKIKKSKLEKYGDENYNNREQAKKTCLEIYGTTVPNCYGSDMYCKNMYEKYGENWKSYIGQQANKGLHEHISQFEKDNDCTLYINVLKQYGQGWLSIKDEIQSIYYKNNHYILNSEIHKIIKYNEDSLTQCSRKELEIVDRIRQIYNKEIIQHNRTIIKPYELDIYLPDLQLAIEYNGTYWHSIEAGQSEEYHLNKSLLCREQNIRLVHIYEFENFEEQIKLLINLINGKDKYPKDDFNKNNLLINVPKAEIIYNDTFTVFGAGKLWR